MKNSSQAKLAEQMIKSVTIFELGQIEYKIRKDSSGDCGLNVWSTNSHGGTFHATQLIPMLEAVFNCYVHFNKEENRCELHVY